MKTKSWEGFITESKKFMNHPDYWLECDAYPHKPDGWTWKTKLKASFKFWCAFPKAAFRFYSGEFREFRKVARTIDNY